MRVSFDGQVIIVTGAGSGLGRTYALEIARRGGSVVVNDKGGSVAGEGSSPLAADAVAEEIRSAGGTAVANSDDVSSAEGARAIAACAMDTFGRVDGLINNAGNMRAGPFEELTLGDLEALLSVHVAGAFNVSQAVWPLLKAQLGGRIVFTSSGAGAFGNENLSAYGAAKGGVLGLMNGLALEGERHDILCNAILPNAGTRMTAQFKEGDLGANAWAGRFWSTFGPEFTTALTVYLVSPACGTTHGVYSAFGGRIGRAFMAVAQGWQGSRETPPQVEDVATHWEAIRDVRPGFDIPESLPDESRFLALRLGL